MFGIESRAQSVEEYVCRIPCAVAIGVLVNRSAGQAEQKVRKIASEGIETRRK